jgi:bacillopeptidase F
MKKGFLILSVILWAGLASAGGLDPGLAARLSGLEPSGELSVIVHLRTQADLSLFHPENKAGMLAELHRVAEATQPDLLARFEGRVRNVGRFWIYNGFVCSAAPEVIKKLAVQPEVNWVCGNEPIHLDAEKPESGGPGVNVLEWNIARIRADSVWRNRGYTGTGVVIGTIDTGADTSHLALRGRWRITNGWHDAINGRTDPYDDNGHGTFVTGIACGRPGGVGDTIGTAPGALFIAAKGLDSGGGTTYAQLLDCIQWYAGLVGGGQGPQVLITPWNLPRTDITFWQSLRNLEILGVHIASRDGSSGPGSGTAQPPGNYPFVIGASATDASDNVASFSSRGPAPTGFPWDSSAAWLDPQWGTRTPTNHVKPDLAAPGVNVKSCYTNGQYVTMSGDAWSIPHVAGAEALVLSKNSNITPAQMWTILTTTCDTVVGGPFPNQNYGWGRLNCLRAIDATPSGVEAEHTLRSAPGGRGVSIVPNPMRDGCTMSAPWLADEERWSIYDATGRLVRGGAFCRGRASWDGRDQAGNRVGNGVYFLHFQGRDGVETTKMILLR